MRIRVEINPVEVIPEPEPTRYIGSRCLLPGEPGGLINPLNMPIVRPTYPSNTRAIPFTKDMQLLARAIQLHFNDTITVKQSTAVFGETKAFTNTAGFGGKEPRANYIAGTDLDAPLPRLQKAIFCGGNFIRGSKEGSSFVTYPGVHGIDCNGPIPSLETVIENEWYFFATTLYRSITSYGHFPQGNFGPVAIPYFLIEPSKYPASWFTSWNSTSLPNPIQGHLTSTLVERTFRWIRQRVQRIL